MPISINEGAGAQLASDDAAIPGEKLQRLKIMHGADGAATDASAAAPLPVRLPEISAAAPLAVREPAFSAIIAQNTVTVGTSSTVLRAADAGRKFLIVSNGGANDVWVHFGAVPAVVNSGVLLPPGAKDIYYTDMEVRAIAEGSSCPVGFVAV